MLSKLILLLDFLLYPNGLRVNARRLLWLAFLCEDLMLLIYDGQDPALIELFPVLLSLTVRVQGRHYGRLLMLILLAVSGFLLNSALPQEV
jgi:hypothetical protein